PAEFRFGQCQEIACATTLLARKAGDAGDVRVLRQTKQAQRGDRLAGTGLADQRELFPLGDLEVDAMHDLLAAECDAKPLDVEKRLRHRSAFRGSRASRKASPMKVSSISVTTSTPKVESEIHHASMFALPWFRSSPSDGVPGGTPSPRKSREVSA